VVVIEKDRLGKTVVTTLFNPATSESTWSSSASTIPAVAFSVCQKSRRIDDGRSCKEEELIQASVQSADYGTPQRWQRA